MVSEKNRRIFFCLFVFYELTTKPDCRLLCLRLLDIFIYLFIFQFLSVKRYCNCASKYPSVMSGN